MLKSSSKCVFHCTVCGHVTYEEDSVEPPQCCGKSMYLACKARKQLKANNKSQERSEQTETQAHKNVASNPPAS
jgi:hypothetical protein